MKLKLKKYQQDTVEFGLKNPYCIYGLDMGLGKSLCALATWERVQPKLCVVVVPAYLVKNWEREVTKCLGSSSNIYTVSKGTDIRPSMLNYKIVIISYGLAQKAEFLFDEKPFLIVDEAHCLASMNSKRTQYMHRVVFENSLPNVLLLTGTPIKNRVQEFYSLIALCNYNPELKESKFLDRYPDAVTFADEFSYRQEFDMDVGYSRVKIVKWTGVKNKEEFKKLLDNIYIRYLSKDVLDLEPVIYKDVLISDKVDKALWTEFQKHFSEDEHGSVNPRFKAQAALKKVPFTAQYVRGLLEEGVEQVAVYTDHVDAAHALAKDLKCLPITGQMNPRTRLEIASAFQEGKTPVIVATIKSFSTGVDLTKARNLVLNDYSWVPGDLAQVIHRIQRIGQTGQCVIHRMLGSPQDAKILETLEEKSNTINEVT